MTDDAQTLAEKVKATDAQSNGSANVHEYGNRVDRSVIVNSWMKSTAQFSLRMLIIVILLGASFFLVGKFWAGILPVILALIVCTVLSPITNFLRRHKVPGGLAALFSLLIFFAVLVFFVAIILPDILRNSRVLVIQAGQGIQGLQLWLQNQDSLPFNIDAGQVDSIVQDVATWMQDRAGAIAGGIFSGISTATSMSITLVVVVVLTFFFLKDGPKFLPWVRSATGGRAGLHATELLTRAWETLGGYIRAQAVVSLIDALFIGIGIWILGVPMAFTLGVITFIAGFIPLVGAIVAGALAVLIALVSLGFTKALIVLAIVLAVQQLEGNVLSPLLQSRAMKLHPVIVLVSVTVGGGLFGLVGAFLAVPVAATLAAISRTCCVYTQAKSAPPISPSPPMSAARSPKLRSAKATQPAPTFCPSTPGPRPPSTRTTTNGNRHPLRRAVAVHQPWQNRSKASRCAHQKTGESKMCSAHARVATTTCPSRVQLCGA